MKEETLSRRIIDELRGTNKWVVNMYGGSMQTKGVSDILTHDKNNILTLIEVKLTYNKPTRNQWNQGLEAVRKGNRFIIAYEDFNIFDFDDNTLNTFEIDIDEDAFDLVERFKSQGKTVEIVITDTTHKD